MFSLIQTSQDRKSQLKRFVESLNNQFNIDFSSIQLIFIDQGNNISSFNDLNKKIDFTYIKYHKCSLSEARNIALKHVKGDIIAFPDDDCWYNPLTLSKVLECIQDGYDGVIAKATDENGIPLKIYKGTSRLLTLYNHCGAFSNSIFLKTDKDLFFDENIGVGSSFKLLSGEETDYLYNYIKKNNAVIIYNTNIEIHHPRNEKSNFSDLIIKNYYYARGWGYLLKKNKYPIKIIANSFIRPFVGMFVFCLLGKFKRMKKSFYILKGRIEGYNFKIPENKSK